MPDLVNTIDYIWQKVASDSSIKFLIASTIRNENTYAEFIKNLDIKGFKFDSIEKRLAIVSSSTPDCFIEILQIYK